MASTAASNGSSAETSTSTSSADLALAGFKLTRVLSQDAKTRSAALLGTLPKRPPSGNSEGEGDGEEREDAIVLLEKTHFEESFYEGLGVVEEEAVGEGSTAGEDEEEESGRSAKRAKLDDGAASSSSSHSQEHTQTMRLRNLSDVQSLGQNDIYTWLLARTASSSSAPPDIKLTVIRPASTTHIYKYTTQEKVMIYETPQMYREKVVPYIKKQDMSRIQWVYNILEGKKEQESVVFRDEDPEMGFVLLPDLKWDRKTLSSLYLQAIVQDRSLRSLRDLTREHVPLLRKIRTVAAEVVAKEYGLGPKDNDEDNDDDDATKEAKLRSKIRCFIHYHPSYYHLHVHVLSADYTSHAGAIVGQAHLLDDVIDLLELGVDFQERTIGYALGYTHELHFVLSSEWQKFKKRDKGY